MLFVRLVNANDNDDCQGLFLFLPVNNYKSDAHDLSSVS